MRVREVDVGEIIKPDGVVENERGVTISPAITGARVLFEDGVGEGFVVASF